MKKIFIITILMFAFINSSYAAEKKFLYITAKSGLRIRSGPGTNYKKVATLPYNSQVSVLEYTKQKVKIGKINAPWVKVHYYDKEGWIFSGFTSKKPIKTFTITGTFTDASRGDCFNLEFKDNKGRDYHFGDGSNNFEFFDYFDEVDDGEWKIKEKYKNKKFKITATKLKGRICEGCAGCFVDGDVMSILKLEVLK